jgi:rhamnogalacturonan endolyase
LIRFKNTFGRLTTAFFMAGFLFTLTSVSYANVPGGGTGTGANVTVTTNGANVVLANGIVSITIDTTNGNVTNFTYNGTNFLAGGNGGGYFYFDGSGGPTLTNPVYTLTVNPANNGGNQAEVWLQSTASPMDMAVYYDLLRGQQGIYDTVIFTHEATYPDYPGAELRTNMYVGSIFDWLAVDPYRFRQMAPPSTAVTTVPGAPPEVMQYTAGIYNGLTNCKYSYSAPLGEINTWGWASSTTNYGVWQTLPSHEFEDGGPMHRELTEHIGNTLLDMFGGGHYGFGLTQDQPAGTFSSKTFGPAFIYANQYTGSSSDPVSLKARVLWADAQAQAAAEQSAWPYTWFNPQPVAGATGSAIYPQASGRATVSGTLAINDPYNPGTSPVSLWIGLAPVDGGVDFQQQYFTSQFWVKTGSGGSFTIPNVLPGTYNLWSFGPGVVGTFEQANVTVTAGQSSNLGILTWSPLRLGPTVWEIGTPDRNSNEFNNGEHQSTPYSGILPAYAGGPPYDVPATWGAFMAYPTQYPNGVSFVVGTSDPGTNWNYCQPTIPSGTTYAGSTSKIFFNLATAPTAAQNARFYIAFASAFSSACILTINGTVQTASVMASTDGNYTAITNATTGFYPPNVSFDSILRLGSQGDWGDAYLDFAGNKLKAGMNEIDIGLRPTGGASLGEGFEYDYLRLELTGLLTPTPTIGGTSTSTPTNSPTSSATATRTNTATNTPTASSTNTATKTSTNTATNTATSTSTNTVTNTSTNTATQTVTNTATLTSAITNTFTNTATNTAANTASSTATNSSTSTPTSSSTHTTTTTATQTATNTATLTPAITNTFTNTPTNTSSNTASSTTTNTPTSTATHTTTNTTTLTPANTGTFTNTPTHTSTSTASSTTTNSPTPTATNTPTHTATTTPTVTSTYSKTNTPTATLTGTPTNTFTQTSTPTITPTYTPTITSEIVISAPFPNPSNGTPITFNIQVPGESSVTLDVFTLAFRKIYSQTTQADGPLTLQWDLRDVSGVQVANGVYYVRIHVSGSQSATKILKVLILR